MFIETLHGAHKGRATPSMDANTYSVRGAEVVGGHKEGRKEQGRNKEQGTRHKEGNHIKEQ